jgi:hypothetical protein
VIEEIEMIDQPESFDGENGCDVGVPDGEQVVAILLFSSQRQI